VKKTTSFLEGAMANDRWYLLLYGNMDNGTGSIIFES